MVSLDFRLLEEVFPGFLADRPKGKCSKSVLSEVGTPRGLGQMARGCAGGPWRKTSSAVSFTVTVIVVHFLAFIGINSPKIGHR